MYVMWPQSLARTSTLCSEVEGSNSHKHKSSSREERESGPLISREVFAQIGNHIPLKKEQTEKRKWLLLLYLRILNKIGSVHYSSLSSLTIKKKLPEWSFSTWYNHSSRRLFTERSVLSVAVIKYLEPIP